MSSTFATLFFFFLRNQKMNKIKYKYNYLNAQFTGTPGNSLYSLCYNTALLNLMINNEQWRISYFVHFNSIRLMFYVKMFVNEISELDFSSLIYV